MQQEKKKDRDRQTGLLLHLLLHDLTSIGPAVPDTVFVVKCCLLAVVGDFILGDQSALKHFGHFCLHITLSLASSTSPTPSIVVV